MICAPTPKNPVRRVVLAVSEKVESDCWCCMFLRIAALGALAASPFLILFGWCVRGLAG